MNKKSYKFSGNAATNYEKYLGPLIFEPSAVEFLSHIRSLPVHSILETSCGTGRLTKHLRHGFPASVQITSTDISNDMLSLAKEKLGGDTIEFAVADGQQLPFADESFDLVVNQYGFMFFPDKSKGFHEAWRVLKKGGHFAFMTWDRTVDTPIFKLFFDDNIVPFFKGEDPDRFYTPFSLCDPRELMDLLKNAGFSDNKVVFTEFVGNTDSYSSILDGLFLEHPLSEQVKEKDPEAVSKIAAQIEKSLIDHFGNGSFQFDLKAWIGIGRK